MPTNFSSGPAMMPPLVVERIAGGLTNFQGTGIGIAEHSHRGAAFEQVLREAEERVRRLGQVPDTHDVLFLTGGGAQQFYMVPMNFLSAGQTADFCITGHWAKRAYDDAAMLGNARVACDGESSNFSKIPDNVQNAADSAYLHYTSNNTMYGTQWHRYPIAPTQANLVCDMSSDIFSRPVALGDYALAYACAQKNIGIAGLTLVVARRDFIERGSKTLPALLQYRTYAAQKSMPNTPNTFAIYVLNETLRWIEEQGGLGAMAERNREKAQLLYDYIDGSNYYVGTADRADRSLMNVTFRAPTPAIDAALVKAAEAAGFLYVNGHRLVGGLRASIYNAMPKEGVAGLIAFLCTYAENNPAK